MAQVAMIGRSPLVKQQADRLKISDSKSFRMMEQMSHRVASFTKPTLGITTHGVFMDPHFDGYNHQIKVVHRDTGKTLPICTETGVPSEYASGFLWVKWTFRVNSPNINQETLKKGLRDFSIFWLKENRISIKDGQVFDIYCRKIRMPTEWEKGYYREQMAKPWKDIGDMKWQGKNFTIDIETVEDI